MGSSGPTLRTQSRNAGQCESSARIRDAQIGLVNEPRLPTRLTAATAESQTRHGGPRRSDIAPQASTRVSPPRYSDGTQVSGRAPGSFTASRQYVFPPNGTPRTLGQASSASRSGSMLNG